MPETRPAPLPGVNPDIIRWCDAADLRLLALGIGTEEWFQLPRSEQFAKLEQLVGNTPLAAVPEIPGVYLKREYENFGGSQYDRAALANIKKLEELGLIDPRTTSLSDITSGSAFSLGLYGVLLGYNRNGNDVIIGHPSELPVSRTHPIRHFGITAQDTGPGYMLGSSHWQLDTIVSYSRDKAWKRIPTNDPDVRSIIFEHTDGRRVCFLNHSENQMTVDAYRTIALEIAAQSIGRISALILGIGNRTTIAGIAGYFREILPDVELHGVQPSQDSDGTNFGLIFPGSENIPFRFEEEARAKLDSTITVLDSAREQMRARINTRRPIAHRLGNSSLMCLAAAEQIKTRVDGAVVSIGYDQEMRYFDIPTAT